MTSPVSPKASLKTNRKGSVGKKNSFVSLEIWENRLCRITPSVGLFLKIWIPAWKESFRSMLGWIVSSRKRRETRTSSKLDMTTSLDSPRAPSPTESKWQERGVGAGLPPTGMNLSTSPAKRSTTTLPTWTLDIYQNKYQNIIDITPLMQDTTEILIKSGTTSMLRSLLSSNRYLSEAFHSDRWTICKWEAI